MKREIKFRAYNGNIMINFSDFEFTNTGGFWGGNREVWAMQAFFGIGEGSGGGYWHSDFAEDVKLELMQFTGLKDKNGVDIYEGDILEFKTSGFDSEQFVTTVIFDKCSFKLANNRNLFYFGQSDFTKVDDAIIIGNIYENPELKTEF